MHPLLLERERTAQTDFDKSLFSCWCKQKSSTAYRQDGEKLFTSINNQGSILISLAGMDNKLFVSTYMLSLPDKKTLQDFILKEISKWCKQDLMIQLKDNGSAPATIETNDDLD